MCYCHCLKELMSLCSSLKQVVLKVNVLILLHILSQPSTWYVGWRRANRFVVHPHPRMTVPRITEFPRTTEVRQSFAKNGSETFPWRFAWSTGHFRNPRVNEILERPKLAKNTPDSVIRGWGCSTCYDLVGVCLRTKSHWFPTLQNCGMIWELVHSAICITFVVLI